MATVAATPATQKSKWVRMHAAHTVRTIWGNYTAFTPQLDPHRKELESNIGTKKTARKWVSHQSLAV